MASNLSQLLPQQPTNRPEKGIWIHMHSSCVVCQWKESESCWTTTRGISPRFHGLIDIFPGQSKAITRRTIHRLTLLLNFNRPAEFRDPRWISIKFTIIQREKGRIESIEGGFELGICFSIKFFCDPSVIYLFQSGPCIINDHETLTTRFIKKRMEEEEEEYQVPEVEWQFFSYYSRGGGWRPPVNYRAAPAFHALLWNINVPQTI